MKDPYIALKHLTRVCLLADLTLMLAWSAEEAGKIIENYKIFEHKPPDMIMERNESDPHGKVTRCVTVLSLTVPLRIKHNELEQVAGSLAGHFCIVKL